MNAIDSSHAKRGASGQGRRDGLRRRTPVMLETEGWRDYALLDSGHGRKLERYGGYRIDGLHIWGATARILGQLGAILGDDATGDDLEGAV